MIKISKEVPYESFTEKSMDRTGRGLRDDLHYHDSLPAAVSAGICLPSTVANSDTVITFITFCIGLPFPACAASIPSPSLVGMFP